MKGFDDFQRKKANLSRFLNETVEKGVSHLLEMRKQLGDDERDENVIRLTQENSKKIKEALSQWEALKTQLRMDTQKKGKSRLPLEELKLREEMVENLGHQIRSLANKNARVKHVKTDLEKTIESRREEGDRRREERRKRKEERKRMRGREGRGRHASVEMDEDIDVRAPTEQEMQYYDDVNAQIEAQDEILKQIESGMDELKHIAIDMNKELKTQNAVLTDMETKVDDLNDKFAAANKRLKEMLEASGGASLWCPRIICIVILLGILGYMFKVI